MKLVTGLGNPGQEYEKTRHNIGFMIIDSIRDVYEIPPWRNKFDSQFSKGKIISNEIILLKPLTFMNLSGLAISSFSKYLRIKTEEIIVIHDDLDLPIGKVKAKIGGSPAGHLGIENIISQIGSNFIRVRIGIGRPTKNNASSYVLSKFDESDYLWLDKVINTVANNIYLISKNSLTEFNKNLNSELELIKLTNKDDIS